MKYRPDIDGLRAVAVVFVVLFHARLGCPGGFVGVDVFFVISGFLITSLILRDVQASRFSAVEFWERRSRRIVPALVVTVAMSLVASWFFFLPDDFDRLGRAVTAQSLFAPNFFHWRISGYFGPLNDTLPLLHTWSLAVEEQFYLIFPLVLLLIGAWRRQWLAHAIVLVCLLSFGLCFWRISTNPNAVFFLLPTRAWELLLGSILACFPTVGNTTPRWSREIVGLAGLGAIVASVALYDEHIPFPGVAALPPCLGAAGLIWAWGAGPTASGSFLSSRPLVLVGRVSYSFYLLHWPALVLVSYWFWKMPAWGWRLALMVGVFLLSVLSWVVVETPIRKKRVLPGRWTFLGAASAAMLLLLACGVFVNFREGFPARFGPEALRYAASRSERAPYVEVGLAAARAGNFTRLGAPDAPARFLLWGDSHAMVIAPAFEQLCREKQMRGFIATHSETGPLLDFVSRGIYSLRADSPAFAEAVVRFASEQHVPTVFLAACWSIYVEDSSFERSLPRTVDRLTAAGVRVVIVGDVPEQVADVPWSLAKISRFGGDVTSVGVPLAVLRRKDKEIDEIFARLAGPNVSVLDLAPVFVDDAGLCRAEFDGRSMYVDATHVSITGALRLTPLFEPLFR